MLPAFASLFVLLLSLLAPDTVTAASFTKMHQFNSGEFIENIAVRSNGKILLSVLTAPILYTVDPAVRNGPATVVYQFDGITGITGILEISPDVFAIAGGVIDIRTLQGTAGTFKIFSVDLRTSPATVKVIASIPDMTNLNGITSLTSNIILLSDSAAGAVRSDY